MKQLNFRRSFILSSITVVLAVVGLLFFSRSVAEYGLYGLLGVLNLFNAVDSRRRDGGG